MFKSMKISILFYIFTGSKSIFDLLTASKHLRELRLMNYITNIRRSYCVNKFSNIGWILSKKSVTDTLTRHIGSDIFDNSMQTGGLYFVIEQWVYKENRTHECG